MKCLTLVLAALFAASLARAAGPAEVGEVIAAERAFAAAAQTDGVNSAFLRYSAPDGLVFQPGPTNAKAALAARPIPPGKLRWWPVYAGIAASGDLGFTTGPFVAGEGERRRHGWYFTIWRRQPGGRWRWVLDHGPPTREPAPMVEGAPVEALPVGRRFPKSQALASVKAAEAELAAALATDARAALPRFLAADGRLMRVGPQPAVGAVAWGPLLASGPEKIEASPLGGAASAAGDLAYTYGTARWQRNGQPVEGHYVRIWQRRDDGWKLIVDNLVANPPAPPPAG